MKTLKTTTGKLIMVDDANFERISHLNWSEHERGFAYTQSRSTKTVDGKNLTSTYLHKILFPHIKIAEFRNGNKLDCRACNICERSKDFPPMQVPHDTLMKVYEFFRVNHGTEPTREQVQNFIVEATNFMMFGE